MNDDLNYENQSEREECAWCGQWEGRYLGRLGRLAWYRCAACGGDFNVEADTPERRKGLED